MANKVKSYSEAELIDMFQLKHIKSETVPLMAEWLDCSVTLTAAEQELFEDILTEAFEKIDGWKEEALKMNFIALLLVLGKLRRGGELFNNYYEETISAEVEGNFLKTKTDFMLAKGILDMPKTPYFHFQEWKKQKDPNGDPTAQLIEAFLIAQEKNKNAKPLYGATVIGQFWRFYIMEGKFYYSSNPYDCTQKDDLLKIIAIFRKFRWILENKLL